VIPKPPAAPLVVEPSPVPLDLGPVTDSDSESLTPVPAKIGSGLIEQRLVETNDLAQALEMQEKSRHRIGEIPVAEGAAHPEDVPAAEQTVESRNPQATMETIRVSVTVLDRLMNLVGELVLARNQLLQFSKISANSEETSAQAGTVSQATQNVSQNLQSVSTGGVRASTCRMRRAAWFGACPVSWRRVVWRVDSFRRSDGWRDCSCHSPAKRRAKLISRSQFHARNNQFLVRLSR
jgi:hypothetical protein